jgi:hypothetical protein
MSNLYIYLPNKSFIDNSPSLFFNYLSNNYFNKHVNIPSINYNIYSKIIQTLNPDTSIDTNTTNNTFNIYINKYIYNLLNNNINSYIDIMFDRNDFKNELFTNNDFQYYTNHSNEILRLLSDNNTNYSETFNISKNYNIYKTQFLNNKKIQKNNKIKKQTIDTLKNKIYELYIIIDGLEKIMYSNYDNLLEYQTKKFDELYQIIKNLYGIDHINFKDINNIYYSYNNKTIDYYDIYNDILTYPSLKDSIVLLFIQMNYLKYNEKINNLIVYKQYKHILTKVFDKFVSDKEYDEDDEILNLSSDQKQIILDYAIKNMFNKFKKKLNKHLSPKYNIDKTSYNYNNIYNSPINIPLKQIPINFINSINLLSLKQSDNTKHDQTIISNQDIIKDIIPNIQTKNKINVHTIKHNNITNEAQNRLQFIKNNKDDVDYMNHTLNFFNDNFEDDENLSKLTEGISFLNIDFIDHFNINILNIKNNSNGNHSKLLNNIINDINSKDTTNHIRTDTYIIDDYHPLSPIYESNFTINIKDESYKFKTLLHFIYFNQYLELYKIYYNYSNHTELNIIDRNTIAYNLIFKNSKLNIFDNNKSIISNKTLYKNFSELQNTYYDLLNNIKYFMFKIEINNKINNIDIPYFNFILSYTKDLNIIYSDKDDNYLGIGKYGNGDNMVGIFLNEYKHYVSNNNIFEYDYKDILLIMCDFNTNVYSWFEYKLNDFIHTIINCCILSNNYEIDMIFIDNIITTMFPQYNSHNLYYINIHKSFETYIHTQLTSILNTTYSNYNNIQPSNKVIEELWKLCQIFIYNIFNFQNNVIENSDDFQTFINYFDKYNIEHLLYYTLSLHSIDNLDSALTHYIDTKTKQLKLIYDSDIDYTSYCINILFSDFIDNQSYTTLIRTHNNSLSFNVNNDTKYINIIKSKLSISQ